MNICTFSISMSDSKTSLRQWLKDDFAKAHKSKMIWLALALIVVVVIFSIFGNDKKNDNTLKSSNAGTGDMKNIDSIDSCNNNIVSYSRKETESFGDSTGGSAEDKNNQDSKQVQNPVSENDSDFSSNNHVDQNTKQEDQYNNSHTQLVSDNSNSQPINPMQASTNPVVQYGNSYPYAYPANMQAAPNPMVQYANPYQYTQPANMQAAPNAIAPADQYPRGYPVRPYPYGYRPYGYY